MLPEIFIAARRDGRGFTKLTKEVHKFEAPFDPRFRDLMVHTVEHLMQCGFQTVYGYTYLKEATNPRTGEAVTAERRKLHVELELPMKDEYDAFVLSLVDGQEEQAPHSVSPGPPPKP